MSKLCNNDKSNWDEKIDSVLMGYRASRQASTKYSPFILHQQEMRLPIDVEMMPCLLQQDDKNMNEVIEMIVKKREEVFEKVDDNISIAQKMQKVCKPFYNHFIKFFLNMHIFASRKHMTESIYLK